MIHVAAFSGGKDSTAIFLWLHEQGIVHRTVFCDTGWEHRLTYDYIDQIDSLLLEKKLIRLKPDEWIPEGTTEHYSDMRDLVERKGRVPSVRARFCTEYLKTRPMKAWLATLDDEVTFYQGIRAEESAARALMKEREFSDYYDCEIVRPLFRWSAKEVFAIHARHGVEPNPLYKLGSKRVGCFPCVMTRHAELRRLSKTLPEVWDRMAELEALAGRTYFPPGFIPSQFCTLRTSTTDENGKEHVVMVPTIEDVKRYILARDEGQLAMFGETPACMSVYNLCE